MADRDFLPFGLTAEQVRLFWNNVERQGPDQCWEWQGARKHDGYGRFTTRFIASRIALALHLGRDLASWELACHHCDNPPCVNPAHLFVGSHRENALDMVRKGRARYCSNVGENNPRAKITADQVRRIRRDTRPQRQIAAEYGISHRGVRNIKHGLTWKSVEDDSP